MTTTIELKEATDKDYLTYQEAAKILNESGQWIRNQVAKGALINYRFKTSTLLSAKEIEQYRQMRLVSKRC